MPFKSEAQRRYFYAANKRGDISDADLKKWESETPKDEKLPDRLHKKEAFMKGFMAGVKDFREPIIGGLGGATFGAGVGYAMTSEKSLRNDPMWMAQTMKKAKKKGIKTEGKNKAWQDFISEEAKKTRRGLMAMEALSMGAIGAIAGGDLRSDRKLNDYYKQYGSRGGGGYYRSGGGRAYSSGMGLDDALSKINVSKSGVKTKAEVKKKFREAARKNHPDLGGSEAKMKEINDAWKTIQDSSWFDKLAFLRRLYGVSEYV